MENPALFAAELLPPSAEGNPEDEEARDYVRPAAKSAAFSVRLTADERALVEAAASLCAPRLAAGTWAKTALIEAARRLVEDRQ